MQSTNNILMVRPLRFRFNEQTADTNVFQDELVRREDPQEVQCRAVAEFDFFVEALQRQGVNVIVVEDLASPLTPDAVFPNNWVSFHLDGTVCLYPMAAPNRRSERRPDILDALQQQHGFEVRRVIDLSAHEQEGRYLESTGSKVLDREHRLAYACLSPRTDPVVLEDFAKRMNYRPVVFEALVDEQPIYHTNVMMAIGNSFAVVCLEALPRLADRQRLHEQLLSTRKEVIPITVAQVHQFAGNMLQVLSGDNRPLLVMSEQAFLSLRPDQVARLESHVELFHVPLYTIEAHGGGSARCMMAEVFLPHC